MSIKILSAAEMVQTYDAAVDTVRRIQLYRAECMGHPKASDKLRVCFNAFTMAQMAEAQLIEIFPIVKLYCVKQQAETFKSLMNDYAASLIGKPTDSSNALRHHLVNLDFDEDDIDAYATETGSALLEATCLLLQRAEESLSCVDSVTFPPAPLNWSNAFSKFKRLLTRLVFGPAL